MMLQAGCKESVDELKCVLDFIIKVFIGCQRECVCVCLLKRVTLRLTGVVILAPQPEDVSPSVITLYLLSCCQYQRQCQRQCQ